MTATAYQHQRTGAAFVAARPFAYIADDMGTGKTATTVLAADEAGAERVLVCCPGAVREHWALEFEKWSSRRREIVVVDGLPKSPPGRGVTIVSHAALSRPESAAILLASAPYDVLAVDEVHEFSRFDSHRTQVLFSGGVGLAKRARHTWCLSGTPIVNSAADLYPMAFGALDSPVDWSDFCGHYCEMRPDPYVGVKPHGVLNVQELAAGLRPYFIRRTMDSLGIPLPPLAMERYKFADSRIDMGLVAQAMAGLEGWSPERLAIALENNDELKDGALSRVRHALGLAKAPAVAAYVAQYSDPVVVFFQHTAVRDALFTGLRAAGKRVSWIDGKITRRQLAAAQAWFQAGMLDVLLVQIQAGGMGLTLTRARRAVAAELPWTYTALMQAAKRIHRIGQTQACECEILALKDCWLEEAMAGTVASKQRAASLLLDLLTTSE